MIIYKKEKKVLEYRDLPFIKPLSLDMLNRYEAFVYDRLYNHFEFYIGKN